jgi:hypothetical protein
VLVWLTCTALYICCLLLVLLLPFYISHQPCTAYVLWIDPGEGGVCILYSCLLTTPPLSLHSTDLTPMIMLCYCSSISARPFSSSFLYRSYVHIFLYYIPLSAFADTCANRKC